MGTGPRHPRLTTIRPIRRLIHRLSHLRFRSRVFLAGLSVMDEERLQIGALFRRFNTMPNFTLFSAGLSQGCFYRQYELKAHGVTCQINETFDAACFELGGECESDPAALDGGYGHF